ncbi:hypothetical protein XENOCAPTIV_009026 [Xenoophorus captivus]|uniref:Uncharacterized protein n=1 Tax=Xenoophorus captivus TaxID=1517983 RepID=A0ABV0Q5K2_9TELE
MTFPPQIQPLYKLILRTVEVSNKIHSYPFKNTVKLWVYKNNLEHIYTTSQALLFVFLNTKRNGLQPVKFLSLQQHKQLIICELIITLEEGIVHKYTLYSPNEG